MNDTKRTGSCEWRSGQPCVFASWGLPISLHDGRQYCLAHHPNDKLKTLDWVKETLQRARQNGVGNITGLVVPDFGSNHGELKVGALKADQVTFLGSENLNCDSSSVSFRGANFHGKVMIRNIAGGADCSSANFKTRCVLRLSGKSALDMHGATFGGPLEIHAGTDELLTSLNFAGCRFSVAPTISTKSLPQDTNFQDIIVELTAVTDDAEPKFRAWRVMLGANKSREFEGLLYGLEKKCHRKSLPRFGLARAVSALYDRTSHYGSNYELALRWLIVVQVVFGVIYSVMSGRMSPGGVDWSVVTFTIGQLVKPFELYSAKAPLSVVYQDVLGGPTPGASWLILTAIHSLSSLALFTLTLLALRWRFRRE